MKKVLLISLTTILCVSVFSQRFLNITNGFSSIQIKLGVDEPSKLHYVVFKTPPAIDPTPAELKALASNSTLTNIEKKGIVTINSEALNDTITQNIAITVVTTNTAKMLYIYTVYEGSGAVLKEVTKKSLKFERKQLRQMFQSSMIKVGSLIDVPYALYLPESYYHDTQKKYPLILFFHGDGQKGVNYSNKYVGIENLVTDALPNYLDGSLNLDFIVVSPQIHGWDYTWSNTNFVFQLLGSIKHQHRVDTTKIYGIGCSGGGGGLYNFASNYPKVLSCMSPISGVNSLTNQSEYCNTKDIPFWGFHSDGDNTVNLNNLNVYINSVSNCSPLVSPRKTIYKGNIHDCWKYPLRQDSIYRFFLAKDNTHKKNLVEPIISDTNLITSRSNTGKVLIDFPFLAEDPSYKYFWYQKGGPDVLFKDENTRTPSILNAGLATYKFRVLVTRPDGNTNYRDVVVTVASTVTTVDDVSVDGLFGTWTLYNLHGMVLRQGTQSKINVADLIQGMYIVNTENGSFKIYIR